MSTIEIVILWCGVSYAIAMAAFTRLPDLSKERGSEPPLLGEGYDIAFFFAPVVVPVMTATLMAKVLWMLVSEIRGKDENES